MHRTFVTSTVRKQTYLDGFWDFCPDPQDVGVEQAWYAHCPHTPEKIWVPGVWNTKIDYLNYEGAAWLRTHFTVGPCRAVAIHFSSITHQANVWLDGEPIGEHYGGFLPFSFLVPQPEEGEHELVVRVDNTHDMTSTIPSANLDWFRYGGITRPVRVEELQGPAYIKTLRLTPVVTSDGATLYVQAEVVNLTGETLNLPWALDVADEAVKVGNVHLESEDDQVLTLSAELTNVRLWRPGEPNLYQVRLAMGGDDLIERTGFRQLEVRGREVLLNGEPLHIQGVNRHEDHPDWGFALPEPLLAHDLDLIQRLGANAIRGAHYPNDQRFLDLCDERGLLFMEEIPLWGFTEQQLAHDVVANRATAMLWGMIERDVAHPCIWAWCVLNEGATDLPEAALVVERLVETAHEADPSRPVTFASFKNLDDVCLGLVDVVCVNAFYGWYDHTLGWSEFLDKMRAKIGHKPLLITEFGAEALYGFHALEEGVAWSEEYQRDLITRCVRTFEERHDLVGFCVWQFCDTRTDGGLHALERPRGYNNKGLLDEYRRPKLAYHALRELLAQQ